MQAGLIELFKRRKVDFRIVGVKYQKDHEDFFMVALPYHEQNMEGSIKLSYRIPINSLQIEALSFDNYQDFSDIRAFDDCKELIKNWSGFFDLLSGRPQDKPGEKRLLRFEQLPDLFAGLQNNEEPVYEPLIVKISRALGSFLPHVMLGLRKVLSREDRLLKLDKVMEVNANSMRWLVRQPGRTIEEKAAANDYQVMAVTRRENYDLLENRVVRDFLRRCVQAAQQFLNEHKQQTDNSLIQEIKRYQRVCMDCLRHAELSAVRQQRSLPVPNYVLQHDVRYRKIWKYYMELLRQEKKVEELFAWQYFTLCDIANIFVAAAVYALAREAHDDFRLEVVGSSNIQVMPDNFQGSLLKDAGAPGPFYLSSAAGDYIVEFFIDINYQNTDFDEAHRSAARTASSLGCRSCILLTPLGHNSKILILLYGLNLNLQAQQGDVAALEADLRTVQQNAERRLYEFEQQSYIGEEEEFCRVYGIIMAASGLDAHHEQGQKVFLTTISANASHWYDTYNFLKEDLSEILKKAALNG